MGRIIAAAVAIAGVTMVASGPSDAALAVREIVIQVNIGGSQAAAATSYVPTLTASDFGASLGCTAAAPVDLGFVTRVEHTCTVVIGDTYTVTVPTPPAPFFVQPFCSGETGLVEGNTIVAVDSEAPIGCILSVAAATVFVEKLVVGESPGPIAADEFVLEVYPAAGGARVGATSDPADVDCAAYLEGGTNCGYVELPYGDYVIGEEGEYGYFPGLVECQETPFGEADGGGGGILIPEVIDLPGAEFSLTEASPVVYCGVLNVYAEGTINISKTVTNDDGGTATPDDWTIELYDDTSTLVTSVPCAADGSCLTGSFPIGEYTVGEVGPSGYTSSVSVTITELDVSAEAIDDPNAVFELPPLGTVDVVVASDDQPPTTTTTTIASTTSVAPTTAVPTTAFGTGAGTLPATGADADSARDLALVALVLLVLGLATTRLARR